MFNIFKSKKSIQQTIETIHNEFDTAGEKLLQEAQRILSKEIPAEKADRLSRLGFTSAKAVKEAEEIKKQKQINAEIAKLVEYYRVYYPNNKFITKEMVEAICKKYDLYCADISRYIGDVPLKNISEIESFTLRQEDMECRTALQDHLDRESHFYAMQMMNTFGQSRSILLGSPQFERPVMYNNEKLSPQRIEELSKDKRYIKPSLHICAPEKDFNTYGMSKKGRFLVPDPIVLQPVKGGYLIVSKWGLEASDEQVINETSN